MTRVLRSKRHFRFHPANSSATTRPFKYNVHKKQTNLQRVLVALHALRPTGLITVQTILEKISAQAADNEEVLGRRWNQFVHVALSMLRKTGYLEFLEIQEDGEEYCRLTEDGIQIMTDTDAWFGGLWNQLSSFEICRRTGQYIQWKILPSPIRPLTRHELDMENRELERQQQDHMKICPLLSGLEPQSQTFATLQNESDHDLMEVDEVPAASITHTPIRKSASLHDPAAYPTPQSLPRIRSSSRTVSISPPQTPSARNHSTDILEEHQISADGQANSIRVSNESEVAVGRVAAITCRAFDWQDIGHVTAISKALQERNNFLQQVNEGLQQKVEVLEKQKEECARQLDRVNSSVERLEIEKRDLQSRSWLFRWRLTALQQTLDSAIQDRERYKDQNARLQARLDDIERRRAAIRRIQDAKQAPDDQLLSVIDEHLGA